MGMEKYMRDHLKLEFCINVCGWWGKSIGKARIGELRSLGKGSSLEEGGFY